FCRSTARRSTGTRISSPLTSPAAGCLNPSQSDKGGSVLSRFARWPSRRGPSRLAVAVILVAALIVGRSTPGTAATRAAAAHAAAATSTGPPLFYTGKPDAAAFRTLCEGELQTAKGSLEKMLAVKGKRTI